MLTCETLSLTMGGVECGVDVWASKGVPAKASVLYLHGGGLLYGDRGDLPREYVVAFAERGYELWCVDYPLAPETPLPGLMDALEGCWAWFVGQLADRGRDERGFLFGRSAGAYLCLLLAWRLARGRADRQPLGVLDFYGFYDLSCDFVSSPCPSYAALPPVGPEVASRMVGKVPLSRAPKSSRYALYVHARQTGRWLDLLGVREQDLEGLSLDDAGIALLPPLFIAASTGDADVPYAVSKRLLRKAPVARMYTAYHLEHDFDRDVTRPEGMAAYRACLDWMDSL